MVSRHPRCPQPQGKHGVAPGFPARNGTIGAWPHSPATPPRPGYELPVQHQRAPRPRAENNAEHIAIPAPEPEMRLAHRETVRVVGNPNDPPISAHSTRPSRAAAIPGATRDRTVIGASGNEVSGIIVPHSHFSGLHGNSPVIIEAKLVYQMK